MDSVSAFGIGKLELSLAASPTNKDYQINGADLSQNLIQVANEGRSSSLK